MDWWTTKTLSSKRSFFHNMARRSDRGITHWYKGNVGWTFYHFGYDRKKRGKHGTGTSHPCEFKICTEHSNRTTSRIGSDLLHWCNWRSKHGRTSRGTGRSHVDKSIASTMVKKISVKISAMHDIATGQNQTLHWKPSFVAEDTLRTNRKRQGHRQSKHMLTAICSARISTSKSRPKTMSKLTLIAPLSVENSDQLSYVSKNSLTANFGHAAIRRRKRGSDQSDELICISTVSHYLMEI